MWPGHASKKQVRFPISESAGQASVFRPSRPRSLNRTKGFQSRSALRTWLGSASGSAVHHQHRSVSSEPYLRRRVLHDGCLRGCRNQRSSFWELRGISRLSPVDDTAEFLWFTIRFFFAQDPVRRFGQVPGYCTDGLRVALPTGDAFVKTTHVTRGRTPTGQADRIRRLDECPFEIAVDVRARRPEAHLPAARVDTGVVPA
jgi:hypothetical protein